MLLSQNLEDVQYNTKIVLKNDSHVTTKIKTYKKVSKKIQIDTVLTIKIIFLYKKACYDIYST